MTEPTIKRVFKVMGYNPVTMMWTVRDTKDTIGAACVRAGELRTQGIRAKITPGTEKYMPIAPPVPFTESQEHRERVAAGMSDLADAKKRYKSPG